MNNQEDYSDEERYLHDMLTLLQGQYIKARKPYIDRLAEIHALKMPLPIKVPIDQVLK